MKRLLSCLGENSQDGSSLNDSLKTNCCLSLSQSRKTSEREMLREAYALLISSPEHARLIDELTQSDDVKLSLEKSTKHRLLEDIMPKIPNDDDSDVESRFYNETAWKWDDADSSVTASSISAKDDNARPNDILQRGSDKNGLTTGLMRIMLSFSALEMVGAMRSRKGDNARTLNGGYRRYTPHDGGHYIKASHIRHGESVATSSKSALKIDGTTTKAGKMSAMTASKAKSSASTLGNRCNAINMRPRSGAFSTARNMRRSGR